MVTMASSGSRRFRGFSIQHYFGRGPRADETCRLERVVERGALRLAVWTCSDPTPVLHRNGSKRRAYKFPTKHARSTWPGCSSAWYDAIPFWEGSTIPGLTQLVVYRGGLRRTARNKRE